MQYLGFGEFLSLRSFKQYPCGISLIDIHCFSGTTISIPNWHVCDIDFFMKLVIVFYLSISIALLLACLSEAFSTTAVDTASPFTRQSATGNCKWRTAQAPYVAARKGFKLATLQSKGIDSTTPHSCSG